MDPLQQIFLIDGRVHPILPIHGNRDDRYFSGMVSAPSRPISPNSQRHAALGFAPGICAALRKPCGFNTTQPPYLSNIRRHRRRSALRTIHVPAICAVEHEDLMRVLLKRAIYPT